MNKTVKTLLNIFFIGLIVLGCGAFIAVIFRLISGLIICQEFFYIIGPNPNVPYTGLSPTCTKIGNTDLYEWIITGIILFAPGFFGYKKINKAPKKNI